MLGGAGVAVAAAATGALLWRPGDRGRPYDAYFNRLNDTLKASGPGRPVMLIDLDRVNHNADVIVGSVGPDKTYRVVVKSLPSVPLLGHIMARTRTDALMVFHQPFLNAVAENFQDADALLGKPMPVSAARTFYRKLKPGPFDASTQVQWLIDTQERLLQYQSLARELGIRMQVNVEIDVGLHRGGIPEPAALDPLLATIQADPGHLELSGLMGYEPQLTGLRADLEHPEVRKVLGMYRGFMDRVRNAGIDVGKLTLNGAGSHTLRIYERDDTMNDLAAGSGVVKPTDFDTFHLAENQPAIFIATPVLKRYDRLRIPGDNESLEKVMSWWDPNMRRTYYMYGGFWKARFESPAGMEDSLYRSTNQSPFTTSTSVDLAVDDYVFLRPTQSEFVMLQFGDLLVVKDGELVDRWPVFQQTG